MKLMSSMLQQLTGKLEMTDMCAGNLPLVEIAGDQRVLIENYYGISQYCEECICVHVSYGQLQIQGEGLQLAQMTKEHAVISGRIDAVHLFRGEAI